MRQELAPLRHEKKQEEGNIVDIVDATHIARFGAEHKGEERRKLRRRIGTATEPAPVRRTRRTCASYTAPAHLPRPVIASSSSPPSQMLNTAAPPCPSPLRCGHATCRRRAINSKP